MQRFTPEGVQLWAALEQLEGSTRRRIAELQEITGSLLDAASLNALDLTQRLVPLLDDIIGDITAVGPTLATSSLNSRFLEPLQQDLGVIREELTGPAGPNIVILLCHFCHQPDASIIHPDMALVTIAGCREANPDSTEHHSFHWACKARSIIVALKPGEPLPIGVVQFLRAAHRNPNGGPPSSGDFDRFDNIAGCPVAWCRRKMTDEQRNRFCQVIPALGRLFTLRARVPREDPVGPNDSLEEYLAWGREFRDWYHTFADSEEGRYRRAIPQEEDQSRSINHVRGLRDTMRKTLLLMICLLTLLRTHSYPDLEAALRTECPWLHGAIWRRTIGAERREGSQPWQVRRTPLAAFNIARQELVYIWRYVRDHHR